MLWRGLLIAALAVAPHAWAADPDASAPADDLIIGKPVPDSSWLHYATLVQHEVATNLAVRRDLRGATFTAVLKVRVMPDGGIAAADIVTGSGDSELDGQIRQTVAAMSKFSESPPPDMPGTVTVRVHMGKSRALTP